MSSSLVTNSNYLIDLNSGANTLSITGAVAITGNLSVSGNSTLSGNILGDRIQNGTTSIDIQTANGNANITVGGTSNVAVFATTGAYITGLLSATGNITANNLSAIDLVINNISSDDSSFVTIRDGLSVDTGVISAPGNISLTAGSSTWTLDTADTLTLPGGSRLRPLGANLDIVAGTSSYVNLITSDESSYMGVDNGGGYIATAGGTWAFSTTGNLTAPGAISAVGNITGDNLVINSIRNDNSSFVTMEDGVNVNGEILATGNITGNNLVINSIRSDDSSFVTMEDGVNVNGEISATGNITGGNISTDGAVKTGSFVTGTIPAAAGLGAGARVFVTDADSVTFGNLYVGGAANAMPVWSNGTNWYIG